MICIRIPNGIVCVSPDPVRLRLLDGRYVWLDQHHYFRVAGIYRDRWCRREIVEWWRDDLICRAVEWFCGRGYRG